jgi:two-component system, chemotaxis family, sensor kinase CheA
VGRLRLAAAHVGGDVVIELSDDGRGLDADAIRDRAIACGLVPPGTVLSAAEAHALIFEAGFSTARAVTGLSGRGVGMDVVRRNIEVLRGRIDIASTPGAGTTFRLRLPLTLAITDGMLVRVGAERFIVPTADIQTCFRPLPQDVTAVAGAGELVTRHGTTMPLIRLHDRLGVGDAQADATRALVVVVSDSGRAFGLLVDELLGQQQFVAKPVAAGLEQTPGISGTAILSDGCVGLLLDPAGLVPGR